MSESELLPCPFCGAQAFGPYIAHGDIPAEHYLNHYQVACSDQSHCGAVVTGGRLKTKADAVKHWNKAHQAIAATVAAEYLTSPLEARVLAACEALGISTEDE